MRNLDWRRKEKSRKGDINYIPYKEIFSDPWPKSLRPVYVDDHV